MVSLASNDGPLPQAADVVVPVASWAESSGTYTNDKGVAQRYRRAIPTPPGVRPGWQTIADLAARMGKDLGLTSLSEVRSRMSPPKAEASEATTEASA